MLQTSFNIFDLGVALIIGLSALMSFFRGFMREILSLGAWMGASVITLYTFPNVSRWIEPQVKSAAVASGLASVGIFLVALIMISILTSLVIKFTKTGSEIGALDNIFGLIFGTARGVLLIAISYFVMTLVITEKDYPAWVKEAATRPYVARTAQWAAKLAPSYLEELTDPADHKDGDATHHRAAKKAATPSDSMPSLEDLQRRVREENERN